MNNNHDIKISIGIPIEADDLETLYDELIESANLVRLALAMRDVQKMPIDAPRDGRIVWE